jgi:hypothetical protein
MKKSPNHFFAKFRAYKLYKGVFIVIMLISNGTGHFRQVLNKKKMRKKITIFCENALLVQNVAL